MTVFYFNQPTLVIAQNGYKNFSWGENIISVNNKTTEISQQNYRIKDYRGLFVAYYVENKDQYYSSGSVPNPIDSISGEVSVYKENDTERLFFFKDSSLFAVRIKLVNAFVLQDLEKRYGSTTLKHWFDGYWNYDMRAWLNDPNRIISYQSNSYFDITERVTYIDKSIFQDVSKQLINNRINQLKKEKLMLEENLRKSKSMID